MKNTKKTATKSKAKSVPAKKARPTRSKTEPAKTAKANKPPATASEIKPEPTTPEKEVHVAVARPEQDTKSSTENSKPQLERNSDNTISLRISETLEGKLRRRAQEEGLTVGALAAELLAEGVVLRAWEVIEGKNTMRGNPPGNQPSPNNQGYQNRGNQNRNNQNRGTQGRYNQNRGSQGQRYEGGGRVPRRGPGGQNRKS